MRLVHRPDSDGQLQPVVQPGRAGRPGDDRCREATAVRELSRHPARVDRVDPDVPDHADPELEGWVDPEHHQHLAETWELAPRNADVPVALVVNEDPTVRVSLREILEGDGYAVVTCPGPRATRCDASRAGADATVRCPRVRARTRLVVLDAAAEGTRVAEAYTAWLSPVEIRSAP